MTIRNILLLDDEAIIAMDLEMTLEAHGFSVLGPCNSVDDAKEVIAAHRPDLAVLDNNLGNGETSFDLAADLVELGVPVVFLSGYSANTVAVPLRLADAPRLTKPINEQDLIAAIRSSKPDAA